MTTRKRDRRNRRRVAVTANLRELYHFSRLREHKHAQWAIREKAIADSFEELLGRTFGKGLKVQREVSGQRHIQFKSRSVADAINGLYLKLPAKAATLNPCVVQDWNASQSKAYLRGMLRRFGREEGGKVHLTMANARWKMRIAAAIAVGLNARILSFHSTSGLPTAFELELQGVNLQPE
jgi:Thymidylate synthase complementing protein